MNAGMLFNTLTEGMNLMADKESKHTLGPLTINGTESFGEIIVNGEGFQVADCGNAVFGDMQFGNAEHFVACWNACIGINPEAVPDLLEACETAKRLADAYMGTDNDNRSVEYQQAEQVYNETSAAIKKAKGETNAS